MNYKIWAASLLLAAAALNSQGVCETDYSKVYGDTLDSYYKMVSSSYKNVEPDEHQYGIWEVMLGADKEAPDRIGYAIRDISGDGIPELIIGSVSGSEDEVHSGTMLYAVYTCVNGKPKFSFDGRARSSFSPLENGQFLYRGSGGAIYSIFGIYDIARDGTKLICKDYYFTWEKDKDYKHIGVYHNKKGVCDKSVSQEMNLAAEDFWSLADNMAKQTADWKLTPFSKYKAEVKAKSARVRAQFAKNLPANLRYDKFTADNSAEKVTIVFTPDKEISNFRFLALTLKDVDSHGHLIFTEKELFCREKVSPDMPIGVDMVFYGDIPNNGISYVDGSGRTRKFTISLSGRDGSVLLTEY